MAQITARDATDALLSVFAEVDGVEWGAETLDEIANILRRHGLNPREPDKAEWDADTIETIDCLLATIDPDGFAPPANETEAKEDARNA